MSARVIALLTDFGSRDGFVGAMKGAAIAVNPEIAFVDVSHEIAPQGILEAALVLRSVFTVFPQDAIFVAVVDPGVGTERAILAADFGGRVVLVPDNGLIGPLADESEPHAVHAVVEPRFFRPSVHPTFHGRDIFAPVAAHIARGTRLADLGPRVGRFARLAIPRPSARGNEDRGVVLHVDRFGNAVTNFTREDLAPRGGAGARVRIGKQWIDRITDTYRGGPGELVAVIGSWGFLEISLCQGNASARLGIAPGDEVALAAPGGSA